MRLPSGNAPIVEEDLPSHDELEFIRIHVAPLLDERQTSPSRTIPVVPPARIRLLSDNAAILGSDREIHPELEFIRIQLPPLSTDLHVSLKRRTPPSAMPPARTRLPSGSAAS
jgi:hypothetical protein